MFSTQLTLFADFFSVKREKVSGAVDNATKEELHRLKTKECFRPFRALMYLHPFTVGETHGYRSGAPSEHLPTRGSKPSLVSEISCKPLTPQVMNCFKRAAGATSAGEPKNKGKRRLRAVFV